MSSIDRNRFLLRLLQFGSVTLVAKKYVCDLTMCVGPSMLPTFNTAGDIVLVESISPRLGRLKVGEIVLAYSPDNPSRTVCKRIKGLEGDIVTPAPQYPHERVRKKRVPKGRVWLEGDNPSNSTDSRAYGPLPYALIQSRVVLKLWPLNEVGFVR